LYLYSIKIQTNIRQNFDRKIHGKVTDFFERIFLVFFWNFFLDSAQSFWSRLALPQPSEQWRTLQCSHRTVENAIEEEEKEEEEGRGANLQ
jgi:hypothetical protein